MKVDLHCHSTHSDGTCTPEELVERAIAAGLSALSITDHDDISAYPEAVKAAGNRLQILPGVELSTVWQNKYKKEEQVHVLGYAFQPGHPALEAFCTECKQRRIQRNKEILNRLNAAGIAINESDVMGAVEEDIYRKAWGRPHIAYAMMKKGYVADIQEAFKRYIGEGKSCYYPGEKFSVEEAITAIHQAGGKAVIAHPHLINHKEVVEALLKMPFDGIEVHYCQFSALKNKKWATKAKEKGLFATGGSDFHGDIRPGIHLGVSLCPEEVFQSLWNHFLKVGQA